MEISSRYQKIKIKLHKHVYFFLAEGGACAYHDETIGDIEVPLMDKHLVKQRVDRDLSQLNTYFCVNEMIYRIALSSLHCLGLFYMDGIKVSYDRCTKLMKYVVPCYNYKYWMCLVQYTQSMHRYRLSANITVGRLR